MEFLFSLFKFSGSLTSSWTMLIVHQTSLKKVEQLKHLLYAVINFWSNRSSISTFLHSYTKPIVTKSTFSHMNNFFATNATNTTPVYLPSPIAPMHSSLRTLHIPLVQAQVCWLSWGCPPTVPVLAWNNHPPLGQQLPQASYPHPPNPYLGKVVQQPYFLLCKPIVTDNSVIPPGSSINLQYVLVQVHSIVILPM